MIYENYYVYNFIYKFLGMNKTVDVRFLVLLMKFFEIKILNVYFGVI